MSLPDLTQPVAADNLASFGPGQAGKPAKINYNIPLPGAYSVDRVVELELPADWFSAAARGAGTSLLDLGVVQGDQGRLVSVNTERLAQYYRRAIPATARPSLRLVAEVGGDVEPLLNQTASPDLRRADNGGEAQVDLKYRMQVVSEPEDVDVQRIRVDSYIQRLAEREGSIRPERASLQIALPTAGIGASIRPVMVDPVAQAAPRLALLETWQLRSYLGDYGLGRTLQTFSLLPGERTTITVQTWRSESATREDASSIFDSSDTAAQTRFTSSLTNETGAASQDQGGWAMSVSTSASVGFNVGIVNGQFGLQAGFAANHQEASQRWSNSVSESAAEHAAQVNNSRRQSVESSSSTTTASGGSATTIRELSNTNLRRVLNFVFRELNQTYETYVVLRDIKLAFYNGNPGSVEIVPLADMARLIRRHVDPARHQEVARFVLAMCAQRIDADGELVTTLQMGTNPSGIRYDWNEPTLDAAGTLKFNGDPMASDVRWRFTPGKLSDDERDIHGVIMNRSDVVLRTDNMIVEALLGQADALDPYASALQALDLLDRQSQTMARQAGIRHDTDALDLVAAQKDDEKIAAWEKVFPDEPEIQVVPVASVTANGHDQP
jgi:hypothetical protein